METQTCAGKIASCAPGLWTTATVAQIGTTTKTMNGGKLMRTIKFRGKRVDNGEWVYGMPLTYRDGHVAIYDGLLMLYGSEATTLSRYKVDPATVGQFTGLKDKNGVEIFEGDVTIQDAWEDQPDGSRILSDKYRYDKEEVVAYNAKSPFCGFSIHSKVEVIGNIHDEASE